MNKKLLIKNAEDFVKQSLVQADPGHDWWHVERARNTAVLLHEQEGGNWLIIELAILLHDVGDRKVINKENDDYTIAEGFLLEQKVEQRVIDHVMAIISSMSFSKSFDGVKSIESVEFKIVQDADRLDAIGAIGIARAFTYGSSQSRALYDPEYEVKAFNTSSEYKNAKSSTIHHFDEKLFLLKDSLNTKTAQKIAKSRDAFMHKFVDQFLGEWQGKR